MSDAAQLTPRQKAQALAGMLLAMFLAALDQTVVATAGPDMQRALDIDASLYTWITTGYLVSSTVLVPVYGKLSDLFGRKRIVVFGVVVFLVASALCGLSQTTGQLIAFRVLQGVGSASLFTSAFAVVADLFPPSERGKYSGLFGAVFGVSSLIGPLLGGFITDAFGWHWVFFINLPIGAVALTFILLRMPPLVPKLERKPTIDVPGAVLLAVAVVPFLIAASLGRPEVRPGELGYLWTDWHVLSLFGVAALGLFSFVAWELRAKEPLVDLRLFKNPTVAFGSATVFVMGGAFLTPMVFLPLFMVNVVGVTATASGLTISPLVLGVVAGNVLSGQLVSRIGRYKVLMLSSLVLAIGGFAVLALTLSSSSTQAEVTVKMVLLGLGLGPTIPLYTIAIQNAVSPWQLGVSTSMVTFFRQMGSTVGIAVVGSLFATTLSHELSHRLAAATEGLPPDLVARFSGGGAPGEEGGAPPRFEPEKVKARISEQLEGALDLATRALEGEVLARQLVASSPLASAELKAAAEAGGLRPLVRARYTVTRSKLRRAAERDASWEALREHATELPLTRPLDEAGLMEVDAALERAGEAAAEAAFDKAVAEVRAEIEARKPKLFAAVDAAGAAVKEAFTQSILVVYRVALVLAVLAFLLTLRVPQLPLRTTMSAAPASPE
ncbi:MAG: MDR family MFS transporter [Archangium sp.]|nr:MDR family MFS transporter [Archangium sp.]